MVFVITLVGWMLASVLPLMFLWVWQEWTPSNPVSHLPANTREAWETDYSR